MLLWLLLKESAARKADKSSPDPYLCQESFRSDSKRKTPTPIRVRSAPSSSINTYDPLATSSCPVMSGYWGKSCADRLMMVGVCLASMGIFQAPAGSLLSVSLIHIILGMTLNNAATSMG